MIGVESNFEPCGFSADLTTGAEKAVIGIFVGCTRCYSSRPVIVVLSVDIYSTISEDEAVDPVPEFAW
jgi:hypothetical protein